MSVQLIKSDDVSIPPQHPTKIVPDQAIHEKSLPYAKVPRGVHVIPSGDESVVCAAPTATILVPVQVKALRARVVPELREVQVIPSGEVRIGLEHK